MQYFDWKVCTFVVNARSIPTTHGIVRYLGAGTKNVAKEMKICAGPVHARDKTWFSELSYNGILSFQSLLFTVYIVGTSCHSARNT